jgi:hypothetical protein
MFYILYLFVTYYWCSHIESEVLTVVTVKSSVFWDITLCSPVKVNWHFGDALLAAWFTLVSCLAYSLTLKIEAICSSKMSVDFPWTTQHYIPEDRKNSSVTIVLHFCNTVTSLLVWNMWHVLVFIILILLCYLFTTLVLCNTYGQ